MDGYCTNCGTALSAGATFCIRCGKAVPGTSQDLRILPAGTARNSNKYTKWALWSAAILAMCLLGLAGIAFVGGGLGPALFVGAVIAMLPVPLYLALALWVDRYEKEPIGMLAVTFLWGGTVAIFFSGIISTIGGVVVSAFLGANAGGFFGTVIAVWNGSGYVLGGGLGLIFLLFIYTPCLIIAVLAIAFVALGREGRVIRQYLMPELQSGLISQQEYDSLDSVTGRIGSSFRAMREGLRLLAGLLALQPGGHRASLPPRPGPKGRNLRGRRRPRCCLPESPS